MELYGNEQTEEYAKISRMSSYERLVYIKNLVLFMQQVEFFDKNMIDGLFEKILLITKEYK